MANVRTCCAAGFAVALVASGSALAQAVLYGGLGGKGTAGGSTNDGALVIVSQIDGSTRVVGHPAGVARIPGLAFGLDGVLYGCTRGGAGGPPPPPEPANLIRIDPDTGALISSVVITDELGSGLSINDLAIQPGTGVLFGVGGNNGTDTGGGKLYTINRTTGAAKLIGDTGGFFGSIAFAPDGTLYMSWSSDVNQKANRLLTLDPATAATLGIVSVADFYGAIAVRPTDGVIFVGNGEDQQIFTIDPGTGVATIVGNTGSNLVGALAFRPSPSPAIPDLNQHGLTGSWFEPMTDGQGLEIEVFPDLVAPGTGAAQLSWFTFDTVAGGADRQRWYTLSGNMAGGQPSASLTIFRNTGGNFNAPPITNGVAVGTATLSFDTCASGQLSYNFTDGSGRIGSIPLTRITRNVTCSTTSVRPTNADFAFSGNWYNALTSGQGFTVEVNPMNGSVFVPWYTYSPAGAGAGAAGQRWYTASGAFTPGARSIPLDIFETTRGVFDAPSVPAPHSDKIGTATLAFQSCSTGTFTFNFTGGSSAGASGTIALTRIGPVPPGCVF
jgi:hypothetical protein